MIKHLLPIALPLALASISCAAEPDWTEILGPAESKIPPPSDAAIKWRTEFYTALGEAKATGRPLLVTWRCLPCKQCATFDKDVLEGGPELSPLLKQFITVRMTDAGMLDERFFPYRGYQDLDISWWGYFLSPQGRLYAVFGGKDHVSDTTRISTAAFANTMRRVLDHHYDPRREKWKIDGAKPDLTKPKNRPRELPTFTEFKKGKPWVERQTCTHCHQVNDILNHEAMVKGTFDIKHYTQAWPLPENVGIVVGRDHGLRVRRVEPGSPAAKAGLAPGDELAMAAGRKLFGQADFRGALHRAGYGPSEIDIAWRRGDAIRFGKLTTAADWKAGQNSWRKSVYEGIIGPHLGFFPLHGPRNGKGSMSFRPFMGQGAKQKNNKWYPSGLRPGMEIVEVNGRDDDWDSREFIAWFRLNHKPGDEVKIKTRAGKTFTRVLEK